ncbi:hypothetical protein [Roseobacter sp. CCS2]|uniref:hypothetical protein n=1 Tax=Roseobacter sp. CCS2 TaxID=391593 RepID=UPI0000F40116|nr:hypothetical protein [Roseobacter sp. CCS2]EBA13994.1 hypothetical protein RCCS2_08894 [Roseobacter sp. CCS2]
MNTGSDHRGGATVGSLDDCDAINAACVIYLRMWCAGPETQASMIADLSNTLGSVRGGKAVEAFAEICGLCARYGRRPLARHGLGCRCVGADEAGFAQLIATATEGDRDDAMLIAILLVRPDVAPILTSLATNFGLALKQMNLASPKAAARMLPQQPTLH